MFNNYPYHPIQGIRGRCRSLIMINNTEGNLIDSLNFLNFHLMHAYYEKNINYQIKKKKHNKGKRVQ